MMSPLALLSKGEEAEIMPQNDRAFYEMNCPNFMERIMNIGLRPGKRIEILSNSGCGPLLLKVDELRIALGRGIAMKIYVRRIVK